MISTDTVRDQLIFAYTPTVSDIPTWLGVLGNVQQT